MNKISKFLTGTLHILFEYITLFSTILASVFIVTTSQFFEYTDRTLLLWIIGLVAAIATAQAAEKYYKLNKIEKEMKNIKTYIGKSRRIISTRRELSGLDERLANAKTLTITGGSLKRISDECYGDLEELLKKGCKLEIIIVNPDSEAADYLRNNVVYETHDNATYRESIRSSLNRFVSLKKSYSKKITIRTSNHVPPFSLMVINEKSYDANIKVELYSYRVPTGDRMELMFTKKEDKTDYSFFINQLEALRKSSTVYNIND